MPHDKVEQWVWEMQQPLSGREQDQAVDEEEEGASFMDFMAQAHGAKGA